MNSLHPVNLLKKVMPSDSWAKDAPDVSVGDRFEQRDDSVSVWVVERISRVSMSPYPLVSMSRVGHPDITKTVSLAAFAENNEYTLAS